MTAVYFFGFMLVILLGVVLIAPLLDRTPGSGHGPESRLEEALEALRELEFEHETGKISDDDYHAMRARWAEAAIAARDAGAASSTTASGQCSLCEASLDPAARFCSRCGTAVA